jgi:uncharacterized protein (TIGR03437 family)
MTPRLFCFCLVLCSIDRAAAAPAPSIASATPNLIDAGGPYFLVTVDGTGFAPGAVVSWPRISLATTFVSSTQLKAAITPDLRAYSGQFNLIVTNPDSQASNSYPINVSPVIGTITPAAVLAGSAAVTITVTGIGFTRREVLVLNASGQQSVLIPAYVNSATLTAVIPADALSVVRSATIHVLDPLYGNTSASLPFDVRAAPVITSAVPNPFDAGGAYFLMTITGTGFVPGSAVIWPGGARLGVTYVSATRLQVAITPELRSVSGTFNLAAGDSTGAASNAYPITVSPVLLTVSPTAAVVAGPAITITVTGAGFTRNNVVVLHASGPSSQLVTAYVNPAILTAVIPAAALSIAGAAAVQVIDTLGPGRSLTQPFTISPVIPTITSLSPRAATAGASGFVMSVTGTNFLPGATVLWNASPLATTFVSAAQLTAAIPAGLLGTMPSAAITVANPSGAVSSSAAFTIDPQGPTISTLSPTTAIAGAASFTIAVTGLNFPVNGVLRWNGSPLATTFVSATQVTAAVPAGLIAAAGAASLTLINPGGLISNTAAFTIHPPAPTLTNVSPAGVTAGGQAFTLAVSGTGFLSGAVAQWNGMLLATTVTSVSQLTALVPASLIAGAGAAAITVALPGVISNALALSVTPPVPAVTSIVNTASLLPPIAPGSLISIYGANLAAGDAAAPSMPLPYSLIGTSVTINGSPVPLAFVSSTLIHAQAPFETKVGTATVLIQTGTVKSAPVTFEVILAAPGVLTIPGSDHAIAQNYPGGAMNSPESPVQPGQYVVVYLTGQGPVDPPALTGAASPASPVSAPLAPILAQVGGKEATIAFAGLAPGFVGLLQMNIVIPEVDTGEQPLEVSIGGEPANTTRLSVTVPSVISCEEIGCKTAP